MNLVYGVSRLHGLRDHEDALIGRLTERFIDVWHLKNFVFHKAMHTLTNHAKPLLNSLLERSTYCHHLTHRLHA